jgi:hypothetical protein
LQSKEIGGSFSSCKNKRPSSGTLSLSSKPKPPIENFEAKNLPVTFSSSAKIYQYREMGNQKAFLAWLRVLLLN